ncbi:MAG: hypothetical protein HC908_04495 [Calothrix sp. SM1_7_51]|nr:hypothetical protein [Calothrix sp. SM1_7_51]
MLIDQQVIHVEQYFKTEDNRWVLTQYKNEEVKITLTSIPFEFSVADIYDNVDFNVDSILRNKFYQLVFCQEN